MLVELAFPSEYICAADLQGRDVSITIASVTKEDLQRVGTSERESKWVMRFKERPKKLVMNKTNAKSIARALADSEMNNWAGKRITLYPSRCQAFGKTVDCVRVRDNQE